MARLKPVVLLIVDGFGLAPPADGNAVYAAKMPVFQRLVGAYPAMTVQASGAAVGLSWGEMGNSEVGHLTIGAGRIFYQSLPRISLSIESGEFYKNIALGKAMAHAKQTGGALHLMGLVSPGGVHASQDHLYALLEWCRREGFTRVFVHAFLDGRDTIYNSAVGFLQELEAKMQELGVGRIATVAGRYYGMDRDNRWDRTQASYEAIVLGKGPQAASALEAVQQSYVAEVYDEQIVPTVIAPGGQPIATVKEGDGVIFFNFRPDRARQMAKAFVLPGFSKFPRTYVQNLAFISMTEYEKELPIDVAFPPQFIDLSLAEVLSKAGLKQLHIAETEKYAHVTFFLNGMQEEAFPGEERVIIPSPRVSSYDKEPEMSTPLIAERIVKEVVAGNFDFIVANLANPDMVAHTGNEAATILAMQSVDKAFGAIVDAALGVGGAVVITADHGNAEEVKNLMTGTMDKEHSTNPVPLLVIAKSLEGVKAPYGDVVGGDLSLMTPVGMLADVGPTVLRLLEVDKPESWTGQALI